MKIRYKAIASEQVSGTDRLVLFAAPASDIASWVGIPQRQEWGAEETVGFQRDLNDNRVAQLGEFFGQHRNVMQNPLLAAVQDEDGVSWAPARGAAGGGRDATGTLTVTVEDLSQTSLLGLLERVLVRLAGRDAALAGAQVPAGRLDTLRRLHDQRRYDVDPTADEDAGADDELQDAPSDDGLGSIFFEQSSHLERFYIELSARAALLRELGRDAPDGDFLGLTRDALAAYLRPVLLVDGQHRLAGALAAAATELRGEDARERMAQRIRDGEDPDDVARQASQETERHLPVSLLMTSDPAEHVFQFVVVNQRATPIRPALLGSIVATSLADDELAGVATRLRQAGIPLEESRAISFMSRRAESPFAGLVKRGIGGEPGDLLEWNVMGGLVTVFQDLRGGQLWHSKTDHADRWRRRVLPRSEIVADYADHGAESPYERWSEPDGPWRDCFIAFWFKVKEMLASDDPDTSNYWGSPRRSNLFNKVTLHILEADFFQYLGDTSSAIGSAADVPALVEEWIGEVNPDYFAREWPLGGVKRDSGGIRKQWSALWTEYRKDPVRLPQVSAYRKLYIA